MPTSDTGKRRLTLAWRKKAFFAVLPALALVLAAEGALWLVDYDSRVAGWQLNHDRSTQPRAELLGNRAEHYH